MEQLRCDVAVLGAGFGGSLMALILQRIGLRVVLLDRGAHPRFAIGESSTPIADLVLRDLAIRYDLPRILPLVKYGTWKETYPDIVCGLKRGFSYFEHRPGERFIPRQDHANELLVAASHDDRRSDTHWLRSDVDTFFAAEAVAAGVPYFDRTSVTIEGNAPWRLRGRRTPSGRRDSIEGEGSEAGESRDLLMTADFVIDATGEGGLMSRHLGLEDRRERMRTPSRSIFAHFAGVKRWGEYLKGRGASTGEHPFPCDAAAQHQVLPHGWMWQLRFDNDVTSVGFMLDTRHHPLDEGISARDEWDTLLRQYPSIGDQLSEAVIVAPEGGLRRTARIQRWISPAASSDWALLPHTAGFIDPLNSTGIAHTLCGIERLGRAFEQHWKRDSFGGELASYAETVSRETEFIDLLISGCYATFCDFELFVAYSMLYFAIVTSYEHGRAMGLQPVETAFLGADQSERWRITEEIHARVHDLMREGMNARARRDFASHVCRQIAPYNIAGLCDPGVRNMYRYTAADKG